MDNLQVYLWSIVEDYIDGDSIASISEATNIPVEDVKSILSDVADITDFGEE